MDCREEVEKLTSSKAGNHTLDLENAMAKSRSSKIFVHN